MTPDFSRVRRSDVLRALAEHDGRGAEAFLDTYGFEAAATHVLLHDGNAYDLRAVLAVAHRHATGLAATSDQFTDGLDGAAQVLQDLDFTVTARDDGSAELSTSQTWREASQVGSAAARAAWTEAARPVLVDAARRYRALVFLKELGAAVQESTGIRTSQPMHEWIGQVLEGVSLDCQSRGEPLLSSLCVNVQRSVGDAYADAVERARGARPDDPNEHAADERLSCYRHWGAAGLPLDGGTPLRTAHFKPARKTTARTTTARTTTARKPTRSAAAPEAPTRSGATPAPAATAPAPKPVTLCPRCFTQVPATGICDYCD